MSDSRPTPTSVPSVGSTRQVPLDASTAEMPDANARINNPPQDVEQDPIDLSDEEHERVQHCGKKNKFYSKVWKNFTRQQIGDVWKAVCNHCKTKLVGDTSKGTTHLHNHLKRCPFFKVQENSSSRQGLLNFTKESSGRVKMNTYHFDQDKCRMSLGKAVVLHEYPLSMVDHIGFRSFLNDLQPLFKVPSRNTIKNDILKIYDCERSKILGALETNSSRIAITTDMWTSSNQKKGFMAVTAHYIDDSWTLQSRIVRFMYVPCPHTADVLSTTLVGCLMDWNLDCKLSTLTVDNCTTNNAMINLVLNEIDASTLLLSGEFFHMRCCAHILNLIVKDGLDVISSSVEKIRDSVAYWTATPKRFEKFEQFARQLNISCEKKLGLDSNTRWNSTYLMLRTAIQYRNVFPRLKQREARYKCLPSDEDWDLAKEICNRLEVFYEVTELFSGTKYPTANLFFPNVCEIKFSLQEWLESPYETIQLMANSMIGKFNKYWSEIHEILALATVLDPRYKMKLVEYYYPLIFKENASDEIDKICQICQKLVKEYDTKKVDSVGGSQFSTSSQSDLSPSRKRARMAGFYEFVSISSSSSNVKTELDTFLDEPILPPSDKFDILAWWRINSIKYPILSKVVRDVLAIPVSTVASESAFSTSGRFVSPHRNRLHPNTLEALMCAQDWLWADIHRNSLPSTYCGPCTRFTEEEIEDDDDEGVSGSNMSTFGS